MSELRYLIISDLHIGSQDDYNESTRLTVATPEMPANENPFEALKVFIKENNISFDAVINLGDVCNKGFVPGWIMGNKMLRELSFICNCPLLSTPGNHDYCFEFADGAKSLLQRTCGFPTDDRNHNTDFWGNGYCLYETGGTQFLILNSESHLSNKEDLKATPNFDTLFNTGLDGYLKENTFDGPRIAILHHHVIPHSDLQGRYSSNDVIEHADKLLNILNDNNFICVLHGHKHLSRFTMHNNLGIMACGSLSSRENIATCDEDNNFHILTLKCTDEGIRGKIETYHFVFQKGWFLIEDSNSRVKARYGFGRNLDINEITNTIISLINPEAPVIRLFGEKVTSKIPDITYISNDEIQIIKVEIEKNGFTVVQEKTNDLLIYK